MLLDVCGALLGAGSALVGGTFVDSSVSGAGLRINRGMIDSTTATATTAIRTTNPRLVRYHG